MIAKYIINHETQSKEDWRPGVTTRMRVSALTGSVQLCIFEQWCDPGRGAPTHLHSCEEVLTVIAGHAEVWLGEEKVKLTPGHSLLIPAGRKHGFRNIGEGTLHMQAILAEPIFEASFDDQKEVSRRYVPSA